MFAKFPKEIIFEECGKCSRIKLKNRWVEFDPKKVIESKVKFSRSTKWEFEPTDHSVNIRVFGEEDGTPKKEERSIPWKPHKITCPTCGRMTGGYYEARIQLRGHLDGAFLESVHIMFENAIKKDSKLFYREEPSRDGIDLLASDRKFAKRVARFLEGKGAEIKVSFQLVGRKEGRDIKRMTYSVRMKKPEVTPNV